MLNDGQKKWFQEKAEEFVDALGEASIALGIEEADYYGEGMSIVLNVIRKERDDGKGQGS